MGQHRRATAVLSSINHTDSQPYGFLVCQDELECNVHWSAENESYCSANVTFVEGGTGRKARMSPSGSP